MLLDSNMIIYSAVPEHNIVRQFIAEHRPSASAISKVEVLGFSRLMPTDKASFEHFFAVSEIFSVSQDVIDEAIALRQQKKMSLGDAIIAATCLVHGLTLVTRNAKDFDWIAGLTVHNPFTAQADAQI